MPVSQRATQQLQAVQVCCIFPMALRLPQPLLTAGGCAAGHGMGWMEGFFCNLLCWLVAAEQCGSEGSRKPIATA